MKKLLALVLMLVMVATASCALAEGLPKYIDENAASMTGSVRLLTAYAGSVGTDALIAEFNKYYLKH